MKILVFAGTTEGRLLIETLLKLKDISVCACVATEYGKEILKHEPAKNLVIKAGRLNTEEMQELMRSGFDLVIDATHPYATVVTENIKKSCEITNIRYIRLLRDKTDFGPDCIFVDNTEEAVQYLNTTNGNILLTIGSKELEKYRSINNYEERLYARVLPMEQVVKSCNEIGFSGKHLICMQGPFSCEMNIAMLNQLNCCFMVTKDTGKEGGAYEKYQAAKAAGATLVVVGRSGHEKGMSLQQVLDEIGSSIQETSLREWFPMFININGKNIVVVGAGKIASRRIKSLMQFSCNLKIVAKEIPEEIKLMSEKNNKNSCITLLEKEFNIEDIDVADIVLAATNNREINHIIGKQCKERGILVNIADSKEECDFYFPGLVFQGDLIVGITAQGKNHNLARKGSEAIRNALKDIK